MNLDEKVTLITDYDNKYFRMEIRDINELPQRSKFYLLKKLRSFLADISGGEYVVDFGCEMQYPLSMLIKYNRDKFIIIEPEHSSWGKNKKDDGRLSIFDNLERRDIDDHLVVAMEFYNKTVLGMNDTKCLEIKPI